jgi:Tfp pilus assembly protein PilE
MRTQQQQGSTLVEIVIVVLIIGMIVAAVLKGQEMVTSGKVKRVASQLDEIRAAYFGFEDRYRGLPGDYAQADVHLNCPGGCPKGNGDSRIREAETPSAGSEVREDILVWTHLSSAGFLKGDYRMVAGSTTADAQNTPVNPYSALAQLAFDGRYGVADGGALHHNLKTGPQVPVEVLAELDRKTDDGKPYDGALQFSTFAANGAPTPQEGASTACTTATEAAAPWNIAAGNTNCGAALLL